MTRRIDTPTPGYYRTRLVKGGPWVPALVYRPCPLEPNPETMQPLDRYPPLLCLIDDKQVDLPRWWPYLHPITEGEYLYMANAAAWDRAFDPSAPAANPRQAINLHSRPPLY